MIDRREEILNQEHRKFVTEKGVSSIHTYHFPEAYKDAALNAMDEYFTERALELLEYIAKNNIQSTWYMGDDGERRYIFVYNREDLTKEQLFENFL
jgi:hypothetical protein